MSFRCEGCKKVGHKPQIVTTKTRMHEHVELRQDGEYGPMIPVIVGAGPQIVEQKKLCGNCS
jgi:hypothetical protein